MYPFEDQQAKQTARWCRNFLDRRVALEALKGDLTVSELSSKYGIHVAIINSPKRQAVEGMR
jgi:hypothetical protein